MLFTLNYWHNGNYNWFCYCIKIKEFKSELPAFWNLYINILLFHHEQALANLPLGHWSPVFLSHTPSVPNVHYVRVLILSNGIGYSVFHALDILSLEVGVACKLPLKIHSSSGAAAATSWRTHMRTGNDHEMCAPLRAQREEIQSRHQHQRVQERVVLRQVFKKSCSRTECVRQWSSAYCCFVVWVQVMFQTLDNHTTNDDRELIWEFHVSIASLQRMFEKI